MEAWREEKANLVRRYHELNQPLKDEQGRLKAEYTLEGMHINSAGYRTYLIRSKN